MSIIVELLLASIGAACFGYFWFLVGWGYGSRYVMNKWRESQKRTIALQDAMKEDNAAKRKSVFSHRMN